MQQTTKTLKKRKPEHTPVKPNKKIKSSIQELPCSQEKSKSDPPSLQSSNQELSSSQEKSISGGNSDQSLKQLIPILQIVNKDFKHKPRNKNEYEHLIQMAATPYDFNLEHSQWISPQIIRYRPLNAARYVFVGNKQPQPQLQLEAKIYLQKSKKMNEKLNQFLNEETFSFINPVHYFRGPSGIGKSYALIQWVLENRKRDDMRILHIILDEDYLGDPFNYFAYDFIYCFYKDLNNEDFPDPPKCEYFNGDAFAQKGEKWLRFLRREKQSIDLFSEPIEDYLRKKGITFILIWDQDNIFQKNEKSSFLKSIRDYGGFNFRIISASNTNEGFQHLNETSEVIEENVGFSEEESKEYLGNTLEKMYGKELVMENELFEKLYNITNGNGYYLSRFVYNEEVTNNYQEKFNKFTTAMKNKLRAQMSQFYFNSVKTSQRFEKFPKLLFYLDCDRILDEELKPLVDRNFTYFEELKLKSVNPLAKEIFLNYYQEQIKEWGKKNDKENNFLKSLKNEASRSDFSPILKGILYERYVIQKFLQNEEPYEYFLQKEVTPPKGIKGNIRYFFLNYKNILKKRRKKEKNLRKKSKVT